MAISSVKFTIDADNSKAIAGIKQVGTTSKDVGKQIQEAFGSKIKQILSFTAVEEGIRRTAEWASEISKTARALGITTDALQVLNKVASKTGTPTEAVQSMFENINKSRDEALRGNQQLILSFQKLGVTYQQLSTLSKNDLFGQTLKGVSLPGSKDQMLRAATQDITGTPENVIGGFINGMSKSGNQPDWNKTSEGEDIVPAEDISTLSALWDQIKVSFQEIAGDFVPLVTIIMAFVKLLVDAFGAITGLFKDAVDIVIGILTGDWDKVGDALLNISSMIVNAVIGFAKSLVSVVDWATNWIAKTAAKFGIGSGKGTNAAQSIQDWADEKNKNLGLSSKTAKRGQALGETLTIIASGGAGGIRKMGSLVGRGAGELSGIAGNFGAKGTAGMLEGFAGKAKSWGGLSPEARVTLKNEADIKKFTDMANQRMADMGLRKNKKGNPTLGGHELSSDQMDQFAMDTFGQVLKENKSEFSKSFSTMSNRWKGARIENTIGVLTAATGIGATGYNELENQKSKNYMPGGNAGPILPMYGAKGLSVPGDSSGGSTMLKMGGMFGAGDSKIVKLNIEMVKLLTMIQTNTSPYSKPSTVGYGNSGIGNTGNMAGGY